MATRLKLKVKGGNGTNGIQKSTESQLSLIVKAKLADYLQRGLSLEDAAKLLEISDYKLSVYRSDPEFESFIQRCQVELENENLQNIQNAGSAGYYQASQWLLERLKPEKYAKKDTVRHEYDVKLGSFIRLIFNTINTLEPYIRNEFMKRFNELMNNTSDAIPMQNLIDYHVSSSDQEQDIVGQ